MRFDVGRRCPLSGSMVKWGDVVCDMLTLCVQIVGTWEWSTKEGEPLVVTTFGSVRGNGRARVEREARAVKDFVGASNIEYKVQ